jgi:hypothetical protein
MKSKANKNKTTMPVGSGDWLGRIERRLLRKLQTTKSGTNAARWADAWKSLITGKAIRNRAERDSLDGHILANVIDSGGKLLAAAGTNLNLRTRKPKQNRGRIVTCYLILPRLAGKSLTDEHKLTVVTNLQNVSRGTHSGMRPNEKS